MHVKQQNERLYAMLDRMVAGVMFVNANGRVCYANHAAEKLLGENNALGVSARYGLKAADDTEGHALKTLLDGAIKTGLRERHRLLPDDSPAGGVIGIGNERGKVPLMLTVTPLSEMSGYEDLASDGIAAGIFFTNPSAPRVLAKNLLQTAFLLGERECDVCEAFLNCATLEGVADALGISMNTVRGYMKVIYEKTGHHSQAELMKLLMGMTLDFEHIR
jgi:DNA-binding CsgD family transcriptional regulator